jgi:hypothetical protein
LSPTAARNRERQRHHQDVFHSGEIGREAGKNVAGARPAVIAEREPLQVLVHRPAQIRQHRGRQARVQIIAADRASGGRQRDADEYDGDDGERMKVARDDGAVNQDFERHRKGAVVGRIHQEQNRDNGNQRAIRPEPEPDPAQKPGQIPAWPGIDGSGQCHGFAVSRL